ncbi:hypothetical protein D3C76_1498510 [compost metagenome]
MRRFSAVSSSRILMLGTLTCSMATPAWRMLPICTREKIPRPSISRPMSAKPRSARGAIFMLRRDMESRIQASGKRATKYDLPGYRS